MALETYDFVNLIEDNFKNFEDAKEYYKLHLKIFKKEQNIKNFIFILNTLYKVQGKDNFKKITGFDYIKFSQNEKHDLNDFINFIKLYILLNGKQNIKNKTGLAMPTINRFFEHNCNIFIKTMNLKYSINLSN